MSWLHVLAGVVGLGLGVYLVAALLFPERFS
jgi:K+-transporting ATPase KdpF subunit